jgi:wee1-like protein kinase
MKSINLKKLIKIGLVSRYHEEFHEVCKLGSGEFGDVFKCINRLDGCTYAIKRSKKPIAGSALEVAAWKEVCAHAVLVKHNHIVQYYSAWAEADRMLIQNEYCNGGSLAEFCESLKCNNAVQLDTTDTAAAEGGGMLVDENLAVAANGGGKLLMTENDLKTLLLHIAKGLAYMHAQNLVHLDIKPGNIFICRMPRRSVMAAAAAAANQSATTQLDDGDKLLAGLNEESGIESTDEIDRECLDEQIGGKSAAGGSGAVNGVIKAASSIFSEMITYKIGDLGHVTSILDAHVEEGDCRYLPNEILQEQYDHLPKADVFALALTVHVAVSFFFFFSSKIKFTKTKTEKHL